MVLSKDMKRFNYLISETDAAYHEMTKKLGYGPAMVEKCGVVVSCNAGPDFIGVLTRGEEHPAKD